MKYGYARVSTGGQNLSTQLKQLTEANVEKVYKDKATGTNVKRDGLQELLATVKEGDTIVVTRIDRLARSTKDLLDMVNSLEAQGVGLIILNVKGTTLDTNTPIGKMMVTMLGAIAQFEYDVNREKQLAGVELAKQRGVYKGKPAKYTDKNPKLTHAIEMYQAGKTVKEICAITGIGRNTLYVKLRERGITREAK
ncbi:recombinase family protein [Priestia megaterium]